jgi:hypothetical protein
MKCNQICPYNTLKGCVVMDRNGVCPLSITELLGMSEQLVRTNDVLIKDKQKYEVVIADDNVFVICPVVYDEKEKSNIVKYDKAEIYANQDCINTLKDLRFEKWKS